jgi:hypothetical protein
LTKFKSLKQPFKNINNYINIVSLSNTSKSKLNSTGFFFKKTSILFLSLITIYNKLYKTQTLKSVIFSLWNLIASNNIIF